MKVTERNWQMWMEARMGEKNVEFFFFYCGVYV